MALSAAEIEENERALAPGSGISDEERTIRLQVQQAYQDESLNRGTARLEMNPSFSLVPQALSVQPATTHPLGDKAARKEWVVKPEGTPQGTVIVYDVPLQEVKRDLLERPEKLQLLRGEAGAIDYTPERIINMEASDPLVEDYQQYTWRDTARAAMANGRTAYRYSKAPWLSGSDKGLSWLDTLELKLGSSGQAALEGARAYVMGVDSPAAFGSLRRVGESADAMMQQLSREHAQFGPPPPPTLPEGDVTVGGVQARDQAERNAQLEEEHPYVTGAGAVTGMFAEWAPANALFNQIGKAAAGKLVVKGLPEVANRAASGAAAGVVGTYADQAARDTVDVAARYAQGDTEGAARAAGEIPGRAYDAATDLVPLAFSVLGGGAHALGANRAAEVRLGDRYDGVPRLLEKQGVEFSPITGVKEPRAIRDLKREAREIGRDPVDMLTERAGPPIAEVLDKDVKAVFEQVDKRKREYLASEEGRQRRPVRNLVEKTLEKLRGDMDADPGQVPRPVGVPDAGGEMKGILNTEAEFSLTSAPGGVAITPEEAEAYTSTINKSRLVRSLRDRKPPKRETRSADVPRALEPPEAIPASQAGRIPPGLEPGLTPPASVSGVPPRRAPVPAADVRRFGQRDALPGRSPPPPEPERAPSVRPSGPGRIERQREARGRGLAATLRARGIDRVYVVPRHHDAEHLEATLKKIEGYRERNPKNVDLQELDKAARVDRDEFTIDGQRGAWSELQNQHSELIERAKLAEQLGAPGGDATKALTSYSRARRGEKPRADVVEDAAKRAGPEVERVLGQLRMFDPLEELKKQVSFETTQRDPNRAGVKKVLDFGALRLFPLWRALESPEGRLSPARAGRAGSAITPDDEEKERRKQQLREKR